MKLRIQPVKTVKNLIQALETYFPAPAGFQLDSSLLSIWQGPDLLGAAQPLLVGYGPGKQISTTLGTAGKSWTHLHSEVTLTADSLSFNDFFTHSGLQAPLGFFSFGFHSETPGILLIPQRTFIQTATGAWLLELDSDQPLSFQRLSATAPTFKLFDSTADTWLSAVANLVQDLRAGTAQKTVLARDVLVTATDPISLPMVLQKLTDAYPSCWQFTVAGLAGATPEMLADVRSGVVRSRVLAGTCAPGREDYLENSTKDLTEHHFAAASVKDALAPLCIELNANERPFVLQLPNVSHLATDVFGKLASATDSVSEGVALISVLQRLHPTAAVCGTPRQAALELIAKHEFRFRGRYAGPVGWLDATGNGAAGLALRCGQLQASGDSMQLWAGCGIMPDSDPVAELAETRAKLRPMLMTFGLAD